MDGTPGRDAGKKKKTPQQNVITNYTVRLSPSRIFSSQYHRTLDLKKKCETTVKTDESEDKTEDDTVSSDDSTADDRPIARNLRSRNPPPHPRLRPPKQKPQMKKQHENDDDYIWISSGDSVSSDDEPAAPMLLRSKRSAQRRQVYYCERTQQPKKDTTGNATSDSSSRKSHRHFDTTAKYPSVVQENSANLTRFLFQESKSVKEPTVIDLTQGPEKKLIFPVATVLIKPLRCHLSSASPSRLKLTVGGKSPVLPSSGTVNVKNNLTWGKILLKQANISSTGDAKNAHGTPNAQITTNTVSTIGFSQSEFEENGTRKDTKSTGKRMTGSKTVFPPYLSTSKKAGANLDPIAPVSSTSQGKQSTTRTIGGRTCTMSSRAGASSSATKTACTPPMTKALSPSSDSELSVSVASASTKTHTESKVQSTTPPSGCVSTVSITDCKLASAAKTMPTEKSSQLTTPPSVKTSTALSPDILEGNAARKVHAESSKHITTPPSGRAASDSVQSPPDENVIPSVASSFGSVDKTVRSQLNKTIVSTPSAHASTSIAEKTRSKLNKQTASKSPLFGKNVSNTSSPRAINSQLPLSPQSQKIRSEYAIMVESQRHLMPERYAPKGQRSFNMSLQSESALTPVKGDRCGFLYIDATQEKAKMPQTGAAVHYRIQDNSDKTIASPQFPPRNKVTETSPLLPSSGDNAPNKAVTPQKREKSSVRPSSTSKISVTRRDRQATTFDGGRTKKPMKYASSVESGRRGASSSPATSSKWKKNMAHGLFKAEEATSTGTTTISKKRTLQDDPIVTSGGSTTIEHRKNMAHRKLFSKVDPELPSPHRSDATLRQGSRESNNGRRETPSDTNTRRKIPSSRTETLSGTNPGSRKREFIQTMLSCLHEDMSPSKRPSISGPSITSSVETPERNASNNTQHQARKIMMKKRLKCASQGKLVPENRKGLTKLSSVTNSNDLEDELIDEILEKSSRASRQRQQMKLRERSGSSNYSGSSDSRNSNVMPRSSHASRKTSISDSLAKKAIMRSQAEQRMEVLERLRKTSKREFSETSKYSDNIENKVLSENAKLPRAAKSSSVQTLAKESKKDDCLVDVENYLLKIMKKKLAPAPKKQVMTSQRKPQSDHHRLNTRNMEGRVPQEKASHETKTSSKNSLKTDPTANSGCNVESTMSREKLSRECCGRNVDSTMSCEKLPRESQRSHKILPKNYPTVPGLSKSKGFNKKRVVDETVAVKPVAGLPSAKLDDKRDLARSSESQQDATQKRRKLNLKQADCDDTEVIAEVRQFIKTITEIATSSKNRLGVEQGRDRSSGDGSTSVTAASKGVAMRESSEKSSKQDLSASEKSAESLYVPKTPASRELSRHKQSVSHQPTISARNVGSSNNPSEKFAKSLHTSSSMVLGSAVQRKPAHQRDAVSGTVAESSYNSSDTAKRSNISNLTKEKPATCRIKPVEKTAHPTISSSSAQNKATTRLDPTPTDQPNNAKGAAEADSQDTAKIQSIHEKYLKNIAETRQNKNVSPPEKSLILRGSSFQLSKVPNVSGIYTVSRKTVLSEDGVQPSSQSHATLTVNKNCDITGKSSTASHSSSSTQNDVQLSTKTDPKATSATDCDVITTDTEARRQPSMGIDTPAQPDIKNQSTKFPTLGGAAENIAQIGAPRKPNTDQRQSQESLKTPRNAILGRLVTDVTLQPIMAPVTSQKNDGLSFVKSSKPTEEVQTVHNNDINKNFAENVPVVSNNIAKNRSIKMLESCGSTHNLSSSQSSDIDAAGKKPSTVDKTSPWSDPGAVTIRSNRQKSSLECFKVIGRVKVLIKTIASNKQAVEYPDSDATNVDYDVKMTGNVRKHNSQNQRKDNESAQAEPSSANRDQTSCGTKARGAGPIVTSLITRHISTGINERTPSTDTERKQAETQESLVVKISPDCDKSSQGSVTQDATPRMVTRESADNVSMTSQSKPMIAQDTPQSTSETNESIVTSYSMAPSVTSQNKTGSADASHGHKEETLGTRRPKSSTGTSGTHDTDYDVIISDCDSINLSIEDIRANGDESEPTSPTPQASSVDIPKPPNMNKISITHENTIIPKESAEHPPSSDKKGQSPLSSGEKMTKILPSVECERDSLLLSGERKTPVTREGTSQLITSEGKNEILPSGDRQGESLPLSGEKTAKISPSAGFDDVNERSLPTFQQGTELQKEGDPGDTSTTYSDVIISDIDTKQGNQRTSSKARLPSLSDEYETAPENVLCSADDSAAEESTSADEDLESNGYFDKRTFLDDILIPETNSEVIINESGPRIIDRSVHDETKKQQQSISSVTSQENAISSVMSQSVYSDDNQSGYDSYESAESDDDELLPSSVKLQKRVKYAKKAARQSEILFTSLSPHPQLIKMKTPVRRPPPKRPLVVKTKSVLVSEPDERIAENAAKSSLGMGNEESLAECIVNALNDTKRKMKEKRTLILNASLRHSEKTPDPTVKSQADKMLSTSESSLPNLNQAATQASNVSDRTPILSKMFKEADRFDRHSRKSMPLEGVPTIRIRSDIVKDPSDKSTPLEGVRAGISSPQERIPTDSSKPPKGHQASESDCPVFVAQPTSPTVSPVPPTDSVIVIDDSPDHGVKLTVSGSLIPSVEENTKLPDHNTIDDDLLDNYLKLYSGIQNNVIYTEDGDDDVIITPRQSQTSDGSSDGSSDVIIIPDDGTEVEDVIVPPPDAFEQNLPPDAFEQNPTRKSPTQPKLFDINEFFDDDLDGSEEEEDVALPQILKEEDLNEIRRKRPRPEDNKNEDSDELPDLSETPGSKRRRLQLSQESQDSTSALHQSTIEMLNHSIESIQNNSLDADNWMEGVSELTDTEQNDDMKSRLRIIEPRHIDLPKHVAAVLEDNTFSEAYKKHGASLRKLVKDKLRENKIAKMEQSLIADLERGGFHQILEDQEEMEETMDQYDEATKKAMSLIKTDWGMLPRVEVDSDIFQHGNLGFCQHTMSLDKYFADEEFRALEPQLQKLISRCKLSERVSGKRYTIGHLLDEPATRAQTLKWAIDGVVCHPDSQDFFELIQAKMKSSKTPMISFQQFKSLLCRAGIKQDVLDLDEADNGTRSSDKVCPKCQGTTRIIRPDRAVSVLKMISMTSIIRESLSDYAEYVVLLLLAMHETSFTRSRTEIADNIMKCLETADNWDEMKFVITQQLLDVSTQLNVLRDIAIDLRVMRSRAEELSRIIAFSTLTLHVHGTDISRDEDLEDPETFVSIVVDFNPGNIEANLDLDNEETNTEKQAFYHMSLLLPLLGICLGKDCKDAKASSILDRMSGILRMMMKRIRDNGFIYRSQVKYELTAFTKALRHVVQKAPKANKSSIFKYLRSAPVHEEIVNASFEETAQIESDDESTYHVVAEESKEQTMSRQERTISNTWTSSDSTRLTPRAEPP